MSAANEQLALAVGLTAKTQQLCIGLESGVVDLFDLVTPTTVELLRWWFGDYRVEGAVMNVAGYNDFLSRLTRRIG